MNLKKFKVEVEVAMEKKNLERIATFNWLRVKSLCVTGWCHSSQDQ